MVALLEWVSSFLITPEGSLIYHLILVFSIGSALQSAYLHWRSSEFPQASRTLFGLIMLLAAQLAVFSVGLLGMLDVINPSVILPPLDRAITAFSLVWMIWLWAFPRAQPLGRRGDLAVECAGGGRFRPDGCVLLHCRRGCPAAL